MLKTNAAGSKLPAFFTKKKGVNKMYYITKNGKYAGAYDNLKEIYVMNIDKPIFEFSDDFHDEVFKFLEKMNIDIESQDACNIKTQIEKAILDQEILKWLNWGDYDYTLINLTQEEIYAFLCDREVLNLLVLTVLHNEKLYQEFKESKFYNDDDGDDDKNIKQFIKHLIMELLPLLRDIEDIKERVEQIRVEQIWNI